MFTSALLAFFPFFLSSISQSVSQSMAHIHIQIQIHNRTHASWRKTNRENQFPLCHRHRLQGTFHTSLPSLPRGIFRFVCFPLFFCFRLCGRNKRNTDLEQGEGKRKRWMTRTKHRTFCERGKRCWRCNVFFTRLTPCRRVLVTLLSPFFTFPIYYPAVTVGKIRKTSRSF